MYLDDMTVIGRTFQEQLLNMGKVFLWFQRRTPKVQSGEVPTLPEGSMVPQGITTNTEKLKALFT
jgi:hypothetical protein